jgi:voltage-gated potassium channel
MNDNIKEAVIQKKVLGDIESKVNFLFFVMFLSLFLFQSKLEILFKNIVESKTFEKFIYILIIVNLLVMVVESEPDINKDFSDLFNYFERFSIIVFTIEYVIRSINSFQKNKKYNTSFFGLIDLFSILPYYFQAALGFDGRFIRIFRLFRISRILKLGRFSKSFDLLGKGVNNVKTELYLTFSIAFILLFFSASGIYFIENEVQPQNFSSITSSFWWAVSSLTGVGFEAIYPITLGGKIFGSIIALVGVGVIAVPTGIISASFVEIINEHKQNNNGQ